MVLTRLVALLGAGVLFLAFLAFGFTRDPREIPSPLIGGRAPAFTLRQLDGRELSLSDLRGRVVFLNFWASWCPPCRLEARELEASWREHAGQDVVFLGVNMQDHDNEAREFIRRYAITYPSVVDDKSRVAIDYGVWGIPETFFLDREGRITYKHIGTLDRALIHAKIEEARRGEVSGKEGKGDYRSIQ